MQVLVMQDLVDSQDEGLTPWEELQGFVAVAKSLGGAGSSSECQEASSTSSEPQLQRTEETCQVMLCHKGSGLIRPCCERSQATSGAETFRTCLSRSCLLRASICYTALGVCFCETKQ